MAPERTLDARESSLNDARGRSNDASSPPPSPPPSPSPGSRAFASVATLRAEVRARRIVHHALREALRDSQTDPARTLRAATAALDVGEKMIADALRGGGDARADAAAASSGAAPSKTPSARIAADWLRQYSAAALEPHDVDGDARDAFDGGLSETARLAHDAYGSSRAHLGRRAPSYRDGLRLRSQLDGLALLDEHDHSSAHRDPPVVGAAADSPGSPLASLERTIDSWEAFDAVALDAAFEKARGASSRSSPSSTVLTETTMAACRALGLFENSSHSEGKKNEETLGVESVTRISESATRRFLSALSALYRSDPAYHSQTHAADVVQAATYLLVNGLSAQIGDDRVSCFALLIAAAAHDVGHRGLSNAHLVATRDAEAARWNDVSVNENGHLHAALRTMEETGLLRGWRAEEERAFRALVGRLILSTDMEKHARLTADFVEAAESMDVFFEAEEEAEASREGAAEREGGGRQRARDADADCARRLGARKRWRDPGLALSFALHCADISNAARPFGVALAWGRRVREEFYAQGDVERAMGLPVAAFCDRDAARAREGGEAAAAAANQVAFIDYIVRPAIEGLATALPEAAEAMLAHLARNREKYRRVEETGKEEEE